MTPFYDKNAEGLKAAEKYPSQKHCCTVCAQKRRCSICDEQTTTACSDCAIDLRATVYVCTKPECRKAHDEKCPHELKERIRRFREELKQATISLSQQHHAASQLADAVVNMDEKLKQARRDALEEAAAIAGGLSFEEYHVSDWTHDFVIEFQSRIRALMEKPE